MKKLLLTALFIVLAVSTNIGPVLAQEVGILPKPTGECEVVMEQGGRIIGRFIADDIKLALESETEFKNAIRSSRETQRFILGCAIQLGRIRLFMIPFFITYIIQFLLGIAGILAVLFVVFGGLKYVLGGLTEDKESGKKIITHALVGLLVALSAWIVVNLVQVVLTS